MAGDKTEKPTPKRLAEARKKGQVAKSSDLNGAVVMLVGLITLGATGGSSVGHVQQVMTSSLAQLQDPSVVSIGGISTLLEQTGKEAMLAVAPVAVACMVAGVLVNVAQIGRPRISLEGIKPQPSKLNPAKGIKNLYGKQALVEGAKSLLKVGLMAVIVAMALVPQVSTLGAMVGMEPIQLTGALSSTIFALAKRAAIVYLCIGLFDLVWQKR